MRLTERSALLIAPLSNAPAVNMPFLPLRTRQVFIMLGHACNMNCTYCLQHPLVHEPLTATINPEIYDFLSELSIENGGSLDIVFYGGEPLVYYPVIKEIITYTEGSNYRYSVISNGRALTPEIAEFFNEHGVAVTISWDGHASVNTRGYDVMAANKDNILALDKLGLTGVISARAYPMEMLEDFQPIDDEYFARHGEHLSVNLDDIMDTGLADKSLLYLDYARVSREAQTLARLYLHPTPENYTKTAYVASVILRLHGQSKCEPYIVTCGNGIAVINVDLQGNLYPCHNVSKKIGDIHTSFYDYLQNLLATDPTPVARNLCLKCKAYIACRCGCKLVRDKTEYCKLKQALYLPMLDIFTEAFANDKNPM